MVDKTGVDEPKVDETPVDEIAVDELLYSHNLLWPCVLFDIGKV